MSHSHLPETYLPGQGFEQPSYSAGPPPEEQRLYPYRDPYLAPQPPVLKNWFDFQNSGYLKGFVVGAGLTLLLANPTVQRAVVSGTVKLWTALQGGVEELKEHVKDIKAEMSIKE